MDSAGTERQPGAQEGMAEEAAPFTEAPGDHAQSSEGPVRRSQGLVSAHEACGTQGEDKCPTGLVSEPELQEERVKLREESLKPEVEAPEGRCPRPVASILRSSHSPKRKPVNSPGPSHQAHHPKAEAELSQGLPLQREDLEGSQSEPSPSAKQHKKAKKRKSLGAPVLPPVANTASASSETLRLKRKAQRLRPLYQYINYCNPELNEAGEEDRKAEVEMEPQSELTLIPEEACLEQPPALLPAADFDSPNKMPEEGEPGKKGGGFPVQGLKSSGSPRSSYVTKVAI